MPAAVQRNAIAAFRHRTGSLLLKPTGEIAQQPFGFIGIVELPSLPERPVYRPTQRRGQPLDHVAGFMNGWMGVWAPKVRRMTLLSALVASR